MSRIVLGLATSHSPLLTFGVDTWISRSPEDQKRRLNLSDGRTLSYDALCAEFGERYHLQSAQEHLSEQRSQCERALDTLADALEAAKPDLVLIVGDDQFELFGPANMPAIAICYAENLLTHPWAGDDLPDWKRQAAILYGMDKVRCYRGAPEPALAAIKGLIKRGVDIGAVSEVKDPAKAGFGHAYGFVVERLFRGAGYPVLPVLLNTYVQPNVPTAARCYDIGLLLCEALEEAGDLRIAIVASGGLSHFVTDEALDRALLQAMRARDAAHLRALPPEALRSGSSEILNWVLAAGALHTLDVAWNDYVPVYRTPAGTGIGLGFMVWR